MKLKRYEDWTERLGKFLESRKVSPKAWGYNDCAIFCADAIETMTGVDVAIEFRGEYRHAAGAINAMANFLWVHGDRFPGWRNKYPGFLLARVAETVAQIFCLPETPGDQAQAGDAVLLDVASLMPTEKVIWSTAMGIIGLDGLPVTASEIGAIALPKKCIAKAWRV